MSDVAVSKDFIRCAKDNGLEVFSNYMKTYVASPSEVALAAVESEKFGTDCICIVDSAGGMLPEQVAEYVRATKERVWTSGRLSWSQQSWAGYRECVGRY